MEPHELKPGTERKHNALAWTGPILILLVLWVPLTGVLNCMCPFGSAKGGAFQDGWNILLITLALAYATKRSRGFLYTLSLLPIPLALYIKFVAIAAGGH